MIEATAKARFGRWGIAPILQIGSILALVLGWQLAGRAMPKLEMFFPSIEKILAAGWRMLVAGQFNEHLIVSGQELALGFGLGAGLGILVGIFLGSNRYFGGVLEPFVNYVAVVPKIIIYPVFILFLGIGIWSKVAMGASSAFFPIAINTIVGIQMVNPMFVKVARTLGAGTFQIYRTVYLPAIAGPIIAGIRVGMGVAVIGTLIAETKVAKAGLGRMVIDQYSELRMPEMYASLILIFAGAMALNLIMGMVYAHVTRYRRGSGESSTL
jgi:ABC-type nitrate/sulfonate/bicarbonate transport system permease component